MRPSRTLSVVVVALAALLVPASGTVAAEPAGPVAAGKAEKKFVSIVFLLKAPRKLNVDDVRARFGKATGKAFGADPASGNAVMSFKPPMYGVLVEGKRFGLINDDKPYFKDAEEAARGLPDDRLKQAVLTHKAWVAIDSFEELATEEDRQAAYRTIAALMVSLAGDDCVAVTFPEKGRMVPYEKETIERLKGTDPTKAMSLDDPISFIEDDDPKMVAAVAEARAAFPEFRKAFAARTPGQVFFAKGHFGPAGKGEYMWVTVTSIEERGIRGTLDNRPAIVEGLKVGDTLEIKIAELNDWLIVGPDRKPTGGGFTIKVMTERQTAPAPASK